MLGDRPSPGAPVDAVYAQDPSARFSVLRLRYLLGVFSAAVLLWAVFGWVAFVETGGWFRWIALALPAAPVGYLVLRWPRLARRVRANALGRVEITPDGIRFDARDDESRGATVPWSEVGGLATFSDWQRRRYGVCALVVLPLGTAKLRRAGPRGELRSGRIVANWIRFTDAAAAARVAATALGSA